MTAFKRAKSNNWIDADNDFGDFDCLKDDDVFDQKKAPPKKRPRENNNTLKNAFRSSSVPSESPPDVAPSKTFVDSSELWINKHKPSRLEDLAVNPKKV